MCEIVRKYNIRPAAETLMSIAKLLSNFVAWLSSLFGGSGTTTTTPKPDDTPAAQTTETPTAKITAVYLTAHGVDLDREIPRNLVIGRKSRLFVNIEKSPKAMIRISTYINGDLQNNAVSAGSPNDDPGDTRRKAYVIGPPGTNGYPIGLHALRICVSAASRGTLDIITIPVDVRLTEPVPGEE